MAFNVFDPLFFLIFYQHFSSDTIQQERMFQEKQQRRNLYLDSSSPTKDNKRTKAGLVGKIIDMIEYNQFSYPKFLLFFLHLLFLSMAFGVTAIFMIFPQMRKPETGELVHPFGSLVETYYVTDIFKHQDSGLELNRALFLILSSSLVSKLVAFRRHLKRAQENKYYYRKINFSQLNISYLASLYFDAKEWYHLCLNGFNHQCQIGYALRENVSDSVVKKLATTDRCNSLYYHNPIDFSGCFNEFYTIHSCRNRKPRNQPLFVAQPRHRVCTKTLSTILIFMFSTFILFIGLSVCLYLTFLWIYYMDRQETSPPVTRKLANSYLIQSLILNILMGINTFETVSCFWSGVFCYSRVIAVNDLIKYEINYQRDQFRQFAKRLAMKEQQFSAAFHQADFILTDQHYQLMADNYRKQMDDSQELHDRRASLNYIIFLVEVLMHELEDVKRIFSTNINLMFFFGLFGSTIVVSVISKAQDSTELLYAVALLASSVLPLIFCGFQAALIESAFCRLCKLLYCLMADGLNLIDLETTMKLNKVLEHLTEVSNRAFLLFADFALTFQSIFTIIGWIANAYPLLISSGFISLASQK